MRYDQKHNEFIIFSVDQNDAQGSLIDIGASYKVLVYDNDEASYYAQGSLINIGAHYYKVVYGYYKGQGERSYYVELPKNDKARRKLIKLIFDLCDKYNQESILHVDALRQATLIYLNNSVTESLGEFKQVSEHEAKQHDCYTQDVNNGGFYICE
jgi:hypothetical protein